VTGDINITDNKFINNYNAVRVRASGTFAHSFFKVNYNSFTSNTKGISEGTTGSTGFVSATCNWWGTTIGNDIPAFVSGNVDISSWLVPNIAGSTYSWSGMDKYSCSGTPVVLASATADDIICGEAANSGSITVTFNGGTAPY
jgi:hypothetical protein